MLDSNIPVGFRPIPAMWNFGALCGPGKIQVIGNTTVIWDPICADVVVGVPVKRMLGEGRADKGIIIDVASVGVVVTLIVSRLV